MKVFAVRDSALGEYLNPFVAPTAEFAIRTFKDQVNQPDCPINAHPEDYELFELGLFDTTTGLIASHQAPMSISRAKDVVAPPGQGQLRLAAAN